MIRNSLRYLLLVLAGMAWLLGAIAMFMAYSTPGSGDTGAATFAAWVYGIILVVAGIFIWGLYALITDWGK